MADQNTTMSEESKNDAVKEARELFTDATARPWLVEVHGARGDYAKIALVSRNGNFETGYYVIADDDMYCRREQAIADFKAIAHAPEIILSLCDEVEQLRSLNQTQAESIVAFQEQQKSYQRRLFDECVAANWDPEKRNTFAEEIAHLHEELSEAFRAWRRNKDCRITVDENGKPQGVPIELADVLIGLFYNAELHGFDLLAAVEQKHQYNLTRNYVQEGRQLHAEQRTN